MQPMDALIPSRLELQALSRPVGLGLGQISALAPSDVSHVVGQNDNLDGDAALKVLKLSGLKKMGLAAFSLKVQTPWLK